jgi:hypothetical protein
MIDVVDDGVADRIVELCARAWAARRVLKGVHKILHRGGCSR